MTDAREVIADWIEGEMPYRREDCQQIALELIQALEQAGYVVIDRRVLLLMNQTAGEPVSPPTPSSPQAKAGE